MPRVCAHFVALPRLVRSSSIHAVPARGQPGEQEGSAPTMASTTVQIHHSRAGNSEKAEGTVSKPAKTSRGHLANSPIPRSCT